MRSIKFRGKSITDNKWIYGYFLKWDNKCHIYEDKGDMLQKAVEVLPESVGQFIGFHDLKGVEIYEGDVVKAKKSNPRQYGIGGYKGLGENYEIIFCEGNFTIYRGFLMMQDSIKFMGLEIIGNIHQHLELLNG